MIVGALIEILEDIKGKLGPNVNVEIYHDIRQSDSIYTNKDSVCIDNLKTVRISVDATKIYLSNEYLYTENYNGYSCNVKFNPETKKYNGIIITRDKVADDYDLSFTTDNKYNVSTAFHDAVDKYIEHLNTISISKTFKAVNKILENDEVYAAQNDDSEYETDEDEYITSEEDKYYE